MRPGGHSLSLPHLRILKVLIYYIHAGAPFRFASDITKGSVSFLAPSFLPDTRNFAAFL